MSQLQTVNGTFDALIPAEMALRAEEIGAKKCQSRPIVVFALAVLAGAFIALGAVFSTVVISESSAFVGYGLTKLLGGLSFCLGLILVIVSGGELFTGNNLIVMAWASKRVPFSKLISNWIIVYIGNFVGAVGTALLVYLSQNYESGTGLVGRQALIIAAQKCQYDFMQALVLGILCNCLVCLAVWLTYSAHSTTDKIISILFPISAFVAAGFEHSVANMYFIPYGWLIKTFDGVWVQEAAAQLDLSSLTISGFLLNNLLPVTIGNIIGGVFFVALAYWFIYLRPRPQA